MISRLFAEKQQPSGQPAEVLDRLLKHEREREERMALYRAAWERRWREEAAGKAIEARRSMWVVR